MEQETRILTWFCCRVSPRRELRRAGLPQGRSHTPPGGELLAASLPPALPPTSPTAWGKADGASVLLLQGGKGREGWAESSTEACALPCVRQTARGSLRVTRRSSPVPCDYLGGGRVGVGGTEGACVYLRLIPTMCGRS